MRLCVWLTIVWVAACGKEEAVNATNSDADLVHAADVMAGDADTDTSIPDPPQPLAPCEATNCRHSSLGGPPCTTFTHTDTFTAQFGVHAYASMAWDGAQTRIHVEPTSGDWEPVIVLARVNGEVLFDGDVGAVRPPFTVTAAAPASLMVSTAAATGIVVYVTSVEALASNFESGVPAGAAYELSIVSDCGGERQRCLVNGRDTGDPECGWLHYVGKRVVLRLDGDWDERLAVASRVAWWSLKEGLMSVDNAIVRSDCGGAVIGPLDDCAGQNWRVGLADANVADHDVAELEELATRLYDGAMVSGILRTTANEAALARDDAAAVMASTGEQRASWLLRNAAVGFTVQAPWVTQTCLDAAGAECYGSNTAASRYYAPTREDALRAVDSLQVLFGQMAEQ